MRENNLLEALVQVSPGMEIWWDSSPLVFEQWAEKMSASAPEGKRAELAAQVRRLFVAGDPASSVFRGCTTNPPLSLTAVKSDPKYWDPRIDEIIASQPRDWRVVVEQLTGPVPCGKRVWYQKHMTHHMLPGYPMDWTQHVTNAFLLRSPEHVLASYVKKHETVGAADIGFAMGSGTDAAMHAAGVTLMRGDPSSQRQFMAEQMIPYPGKTRLREVRETDPHHRI